MTVYPWVSAVEEYQLYSSTAETQGETFKVGEFYLVAVSFCNVTFGTVEDDVEVKRKKSLFSVRFCYRIDNCSKSVLYIVANNCVTIENYLVLIFKKFHIYLPELLKVIISWKLMTVTDALNLKYKL